MAYPVLSTSIQTLLGKSNGQLILPALQREFVWKPKDICALFDSLMQGFPINTMMLWRVSNLANQPIAFYQFLSPKYVEGNTNQLFNNKVCPDGQQYDVVIDGQQRITSLLIGFSGSYQTSSTRQPSCLYIRLDQPNTNKEFKYDFQFLTAAKLTSCQKKSEVWAKVSDVLSPTYNVVGELTRLGVVNNAYAQTTLNLLANLVSNNNVLNYYEITSSNIDDVLDIFVRTNSGGYSLKKGDLLMSALTIDWANAGNYISAREYVEDIIADVESLGYQINKDWVFNMFLMLSGANLSLKVSAFMAGSNIPQFIYNNHVEIAECVHKAFTLINAYHLVEKGLTTKLAVIPLVYYLFQQQLNKTAILPSNAMNRAFDDMRHFVYRAIVKNLFEAGTDATLQTIRSIIDQYATKTYFPENEIEKNITKMIVTSADVDNLLKTKKADAFPVLNIIYALGYDHHLCSMCPEGTAQYDVDHMHPKKIFTSNQLSAIAFHTAADQQIATDGKTFDTIVNLELLDSPTNRSKNKQELSLWLKGVSAAESIKLPKDHFFDGLPVDMSDFGTFVQQREKLLRNVLNLL